MARVKSSQLKAWFWFLGGVSSFPSSCQQSVHLTLGILRQSQAVFYALSFFWLDGFAVPAPAQVTQTVRRLPCKFIVKKTGRYSNEQEEFELLCFCL